MRLTSGEIRESLSNVTNQIIEHIKELIEEVPPELVGDILESGIHLAGGGALIPGIDKMIAENVRMPAIVTDDPQTAVVCGAAEVLQHPKLLAKVKITGGLN